MLEQFKPQRITWDRAHQYIHERINANQGDSNGRVLEVQVLNGGQTEDLGSSTLSLGWRTKNGEHEGLDAFTVKDASIGLYEIVFTTAMLSNVGKLTASLVLVTTSGRIQSNPFTINNVRSVVSDEVAQGENSFTALTTALIEVNGWNERIDTVEQDFKDRADAMEAQYPVRLNDVDAQLAQKETEITLARDGETTLRDRLNRDHQEVTAQLAHKARQEYAEEIENRLNSVIAGLDGTEEFYTPIGLEEYMTTNGQEWTI